MKFVYNFYALLSIILLSIFLVSCNSMDSDAKKAAQLTNQSIEEMTTLKLDEAQISYKKAQDIIRKYEEKGKAGEFMPLYRMYRDEGKYIRP